MVYRRYFEAAVSRLKDERRYRVFAHLERDVEAFPQANWHRDDGSVEPVTIWCSNDYLGMGQHPDVIAAMVETANKVGAGAGGTRNISGTSHAIVELERELADLHGKEARARLHLRLDFQSRGDFDDRRPLAQLRHSLRRLQSQFDDRRREALARRKEDLPPQ